MSEKKRVTVLFSKTVETEDVDTAVESFIDEIGKIARDSVYITIDVHEAPEQTVLHVSSGYNGRGSEPKPVCPVCDGVGRVDREEQPCTMRELSDANDAAG